MILVYILLQFPLADSLFTHGMYPEARVEYLREFFFYPASYHNENKRISFALSTIYVDTSAGIRELRRLADDFDNMSPQSRMRIAEQYIALGYTQQARTILNTMDTARIYGYTHLVDGNVRSARAHFLKIGDSTLVNDIDQYLTKPEKSLRTATVLSCMCPGAGEIYAGNVSLGIKNFLLNAGSIFLLYNAVHQKKYVDALLVFSFLFNRFYVGSIYNAQQSVFKSREQTFQNWHEYMDTTYFPDMNNR